jgi:aerobic-type carbon monoxide dehydrogenase small subunit (CoxS/CutS family)
MGVLDMKVEFFLNGKMTRVETDVAQNLLRMLREQLGLTGTKCGCDTGDCGACGVLLDDKLVYSCLVSAADLAGHQVTTIEGLQSADGNLSDLQQAFLNHGAVQCGFCIPAMILAGEALLRQNLAPTRDEIRTAISHVLCRCTGYQQIIDAIGETAQLRRIVALEGNPHSSQPSEPGGRNG